MDTLNPSQLQAVTTDAPLVLVVAGPGSGKTRVTKDRIIRLIRHEGVPAEKILAITFTNAGADELSQRLAKELAGVDAALGAAGKVALGYCGTLHGFCLRLIRQYGELVGLPKSFAVCDEEQREQLVELAIEQTNWTGTRKAVDAWIKDGPLPVRTTGQRLDKADVVARAYFRNMHMAGVLDFDCILHYGLALIPKIEHWPYSFLFVDEFQDSGDLDFKIYRAVPIKNKFFVGDPDQGIYGFRGADIKNILALARRSDCQKITLEQNYRCAENICHAAQTLINHNQDRVPKVTTSATGVFGTAEVWKPFNSAIKEVAQIATDISALADENDCAVLVYTNFLANQIATQLQATGLRLNRKEYAPLPIDWKRTRLLVALLSNPYSDIVGQLLLESLFSAPKAKHIVTDAQLAAKSLNDYHFKLPFVTALGEVPARLNQFGIGPESQLKVMEAIGMLPPGSTVTDLNFSLARDFAHRPEIGNGVVVTTMHAAKGREWATVYLPAFEQQVIPNCEPSDEELAEFRRLAYVAFTRAKNRLVISYCRERGTEWNSRPVPVNPSQFLIEAGFVPHS